MGTRDVHIFIHRGRDSSETKHDPSNGQFAAGGSSGKKAEGSTSSKPPSPHASEGSGEFEHKGSANLKAQGLKPQSRGEGNSSSAAALVCWKAAQTSGKPATVVMTGRGWAVLGKGEKLARGQPHMTVSPEGQLHAYEGKR